MSDQKDVDKLTDGRQHSAAVAINVHQAAQEKPRASANPLMLLWMALNSAMAIAALIMAAWSTSRVDNAVVVGGSTGVVLTSSPRSSVPANYALTGNLFAGTGYWFNAPPMIYQRSDHASVPYGDFIYLFGGVTNTTNGDALVLNQVTKYYTVNGKTQLVTAMPDARYRFGYGVINDTYGNQLVYIFGGYNFTNATNGVTLDPPVATTMMYNFTSDQWLMLPESSNLNVARSDLIGGGVNGKIYAAGGWDVTFRYPLASVEEFDPATGVWRFVANLTTPRGDAKSAVLDGLFFVIGGVSHNEDPKLDCGGADWLTCNPFSTAVEAYDPTTGRWQQKANMTYARGDFAAEALPGGRIIAAGGETGNGTQNQMAVHYVEMYRHVDDAWVPKAPLPQPRFRYDIAHINDMVYVSGGAPTCSDGVPAEFCFNANLDTVLAFFDIEYPSLWAYTHKSN